MAAPTFTALPTAPARTMDSTTFASTADTFVAALGPFQIEGDVLGAYCETQAQAALAAAIAGNLSGLDLTVGAGYLIAVNLAGDAIEFVEINEANLATVSEILSKTTGVVVSPEIVRDAAASVALTDGANISWDLNAGINFDVRLSGDRTLDNPSNMANSVGQTGRIEIRQDATGTHTIAFGNQFKFENGVLPTLTNQGLAQDAIYYDIRSATEIWCFPVRKMS